MSEAATGPRGRPTHVRHLVELPKVAVALAVLVVTSVVARAGVPTWERELFIWFYGRRDVWEWVLWAPMQLGSLAGPVLVAIGSWIAWRRWRPTVGALVVGVAAWQAAKAVKAVIDRGRPGDVLVDLLRRPGTPLDGLGFVSGHSAVAFGLATVLSPYLERPGRWIAYGLAVIVAVARMHVGAHFPLDTVGGAAVGITLGLCWHLAVGVPEDVPLFEEAAPPGEGSGPAS